MKNTETGSHCLTVSQIVSELKVPFKFFNVRHVIAFIAFFFLVLSRDVIISIVVRLDPSPHLLFICMVILVNMVVPVLLVVWLLRSCSPFWNFIVVLFATLPVLDMPEIIAFLSRHHLAYECQGFTNLFLRSVWLAVIALGAGLYPSRKIAALAVAVAGLVLFLACCPLDLMWSALMSL